MTKTTNRILAWSLGGLAVVAILAGAVFAWMYPSATEGREEAVWVLSWIGFPVVGALVTSRRPDTHIGWILIAIGAGLGMGITANGLAAYEVNTAPGTIPGYEWWNLLGGATIVPAFLLVPFLILFFPQDVIPSRRMAVVARIGAATGVAIWLAGILRERGQVTGGTWVDNPLGVPALGPTVEAIIPVAGVLYAGFALIVVGNAVWRFFRSRGIERQQMKWFVYAAAMFPVMITVAGSFEGTGNETVSEAIFLVAFFAALNGMAAAIGIAVTRYHLYDIDVVISKTVVFAGLAAFITAIYVGIVVGVGTLLGADDEPNLALSIVATAVVAVAFQPVRERLTRLANRLVFGRRATPYEVLSRFSSHLGETVATEDTLERMARLLADGTGAAHAQVSLAIGGQMIPAASVGQVADASADAHTVEVTHQGEALGALSVTKKRGETLTPADVKLVDDLAAQAGLLLRNVGLTEELKARIVDLRASRQRLVAAQDAERRRLERDLHDGAQQQIVAMKLKLGIARTLAEREGATRTVELVEQLAAETDDAVQTLRELAHGIYPPLLAAEGLQAAISTAARRAPVPVAVGTDGIGRYDQDVEAAVYFCVLEAINNAAKYAEPDQVTVTLAQTDGHLTFEVTDDGAGFDPSSTALGHGLTNMTDRLDALGGQLEIRSVRGSGTTVAGLVPALTPEMSA